ncbi:MAG: tyrosine recombinase [Actinobacteria bacterium]|nr:tyrosine recombinase [Actinomycetota bacterium]
MTFASEARAFLDYLRVERGLAENSILAYQRDLRRFGDFLDERSSAIEDVTAQIVLDYQGSLREAQQAESSISRSLSALRSFFAYLTREKSFTNPMGEIEQSRQVRRLPKALTFSEVLSLIEASSSDGSPIHLRERALLELLYGTGARVSEIVGLDVADFLSVETGVGAVETLKLKGKGGKERIVPLGSYASAAVHEYLVRVRPDLALKSKRPSSALFLNMRGTRLTRQSAWQFVLDAATKVGLESKVSPHVFRHSYATHLLDGGADIRVVQELLGHASATTTQIYTLITIDKIRESYSSAHPRAR